MPRSCRLTTLSLAAALTLVPACTPREAATQPDASPAPVILISIDTLRADRLPAWGYDKVETPAIDALRQDGIQFRNAWSHVPLTLPSHVSMLTGLLPYEHGVRDNLGFSFDAAKHPPVTKALQQSGYATGASVSAWVLRAETGISSSFDFYDDAVTERSGTPVGNLQRSGAAALATATEWMSSRGNQPFFLMLHLFEPHSPWDPPEPFRSRYSDPYDGEIAAADAVVGQLVSFLRERNLYDRALIILLSDHGEGLGDHGETEHGVLLYREALHVPLIVKLPDNTRAGTTVDDVVQLIDVAPTIAAVTGVPFGPTPHGISLLAEERAPRTAYAETLYPRLHFGWADLRSLRDARHHFIDAPELELYDLETDPRESRNIASEERRVLAALRAALDAHPKVDAAPVIADPEEAKKLAALGYVGSGGTEGGDRANPRERIAEIEALREGLALESTASPAEVVAFYAAVVERNPDSVDVRGQYAAALSRAGRLADAEMQYKEALRRRPLAWHGVAIALAELQLRMKKLDEAEEHARLAMERSPAHARRILARVEGARGNFDEAERVLGSPADDPSLRAWVELAQIRANQRRIPEAIEILERTRDEARAKGIDVELLHFALGDLYGVTRRLPEAELAFRDEIRAFPRNIHAWSRLAMALAAQGKRDELPLLFSEMVRLNPTGEARALAESTRKRVGM